ncbi:hypothetical protein GCM10010912_42500 [Paenibacillus albidus]|uniref:DUF2564 family protein n=1 Tax=Paenibacillus albidus TaxID=2041023 RepID=A0A917CPL2_9BACL|nr:hypothetical protein [Paenibacillus albidus]GGF92962.1 hypothetical protein GCM10010912_42500 [Paenibacillus albidus]
MKHYDSSLQDNNTAAQVKNSVSRLHGAVSQALSHPNEQTTAQAANSLEHAEEAIRQAEQTLDDQGVQYLEGILEDEKSRMSPVNQGDNQ